MASARRDDWSNTARPMMLWPEARRSPSVGIDGATPTPSADTHAIVRPAAASPRRCKKRSRLSSGKRDSAHVVVTTGTAPAGTRAKASASPRRRHLAAAAEGPPRPAPSDHRGVPLARRRRLDGAQRLVGLTQGDSDALVQRRCSGGGDRTEAPEHLSERAAPAHGCGAAYSRPWHPGDSNHWHDNHVSVAMRK